MNVRLTLIALAVLACAATAPARDNLVRNPSFEADAGKPGVPDEWRVSGDPRHVTQALTLDQGRDGKRCAKLACTRFEHGGPSSHAMLCQYDLPIRRGKCYRVTFWARGQDISAETVSLRLADTSSWTSCGLEDVLPITRDWKRYESVFRGTCDAKKNRLQFAFVSTGTLWVDDVVLEEIGNEIYRPGHVIPADRCVNLIPNASFECGTAGWGSADAVRFRPWGGALNRLVGQLDPHEALDGRTSLRVDLEPGKEPVLCFDYFEPYRTPIKAPLAANIGYIEVEPGRPYVFSAWIKARQPNTPARLAVREFQGRAYEQAVSVPAEWQRYVLRFKPAARWCYVLAGPDLRPTKECPAPPDHATLWLDALDLRQAEQPGPFVRRSPVEFGLTTDRPGNVFAQTEPLQIHLALANAGPQTGAAQVELRLTDFFDQEVWRDTLRRNVPSNGRTDWDLALDPRAQRRGFLRLHAKLTVGNVVRQQTMRLAVIPLHAGSDSRFGVNHAYPWPHLLELNRKAGLTWVRDWSLKWQDVEPEQGRFTFAETDFQIDRPLGHGLHVLGLLPFPASNWASTAPPDVGRGAHYPQTRERAAYAPRDAGEFENYVQCTVAHYQQRIDWWQVFNEPLYTSYALPRRLGYNGATYAQWTQAFVRAARRADPKCHILAGIGGLSPGPIMADFEQFFAAGGLQGVDAVDIHHYPQIRPPEYLEGLLESLHTLMDKYGRRKPIWLTEFGYYADDEPWIVPMIHDGFDRPLESERLQAEYAMRWTVIMLANGVDRLFYHAGTSCGINSDSLEGVFYKYAGAPHKIYAAQAVAAQLFTPTCKFAKRLALGNGIKAYLFRDGQRLVAAVWSIGNAPPREIHLSDPRLQAWDIMGRPQPLRSITPSGTPTYLIGQGLSAEQFEQALARSPAGR